MTRYMLIINYTKNNPIVYFIILNFFIFFIILSSIIFVIAAIKINNKYLNPLLYIQILQFIIPFISTYFFSQFFYSLLTVFSCDDKDPKASFFSQSYKCLNGMWFYIQVPLCSISLILLLFISFITNLIFYNPMCLRAENKKIHSLPDVIFLLTKIIMNILFVFFKNQKDSYPLLIICIILTGINSYYLINYQGYSNSNMFFINCLLSIYIFLGFSSLL